MKLLKSGYICSMAFFFVWMLQGCAREITVSEERSSHDSILAVQTERRVQLLSKSMNGLHAIDSLLNEFSEAYLAAAEDIESLRARTASLRLAADEQCESEIADELRQSAAEVKDIVDQSFPSGANLRRFTLDSEVERIRVVSAVQKYVIDKDLKCHDLGYCDGGTDDDAVAPLASEELLAEPWVVSPSESRIRNELHLRCVSASCSSNVEIARVVGQMRPDVVELVRSLSFLELAHLVLGIIKSRDQDIRRVEQAISEIDSPKISNPYRQDSLRATARRAAVRVMACDVGQMVERWLEDEILGKPQDRRQVIVDIAGQIRALMRLPIGDSEIMRRFVSDFSRNSMIRTQTELSLLEEESGDSNHHLTFLFRNFLVLVYEMSGQRGYSVFDLPGGDLDPSEWQLPSPPITPGYLRRGFREDLVQSIPED